VYAKLISMEHFVMTQLQVSVQATLVSMVEYVEKIMQHLNVYVMKLLPEVIVKFVILVNQTHVIMMAYAHMMKMAM